MIKFLYPLPHIWKQARHVGRLPPLSFLAFALSWLVFQTRSLPLRDLFPHPPRRWSSWSFSCLLSLSLVRPWPTSHQTRDSPVGRQQRSIELGDLRVVGKLGSARARVEERKQVRDKQVRDETRRRELQRILSPHLI